MTLESGLTNVTTLSVKFRLGGCILDAALPFKAFLNMQVAQDLPIVSNICFALLIIPPDNEMRDF